MPRLLALAVLVFVFAGCKREQVEDIAFDTKETLPGFTVLLPSGKRLKSDVALAAGQVVVEHSGVVVTVGWQAGRMAKEDLAIIATGMQSAIGVKSSGPIETTDVAIAAPDYGSEFLLPTDKKVALAVSVVQCMTSNVTVTIATMAAPELERARVFHQRLVGTLQCGDAGSAMTTDVGLPTFSMGDAIAYLPGSDPPTYFSLTGARWYVTPGVPSMRVALEKPEMVAGLLGGLGIEVLEQTPLPAQPNWLQVQLSVSIEGERGFIGMGVLTCGEAAYSVMHMKGDLTAPDPADLMRVQCPTAPVDAATLPTVADRFGKPCDAGKAEVCELLAMLAEEEPERLAGIDPAKLRKRACELGLARACG